MPQAPLGLSHMALSLLYSLDQAPIVFIYRGDPETFLPQKSRGICPVRSRAIFSLACLMVRAMFILVAAAHLSGCRAHGVRAAPAPASVAAFWPTP